MTIETFLSRVQKAKRTGAGRWVACCPYHEDKSPSLAIREMEDGRVLIHCFAGCSVEEILGAAGLEFDALFPEKPIENGRLERRPFNAADVLECVIGEARLVAMAARADLSEADRERLMLAAERLEQAGEMIRG